MEWGALPDFTSPADVGNGTADALSMQLGAGMFGLDVLHLSALDGTALNATALDFNALGERVPAFTGTDDLPRSAPPPAAADGSANHAEPGVPAPAADAAIPVAEPATALAQDARLASAQAGTEAQHLPASIEQPVHLETKQPLDLQHVLEKHVASPATKDAFESALQSGQGQSGALGLGEDKPFMLGEGYGAAFVSEDVMEAAVNLAQQAPGIPGADGQMHMRVAFDQAIGVVFNHSPEAPQVHVETTNAAVVTFDKDGQVVSAHPVPSSDAEADLTGQERVVKKVDVPEEVATAQPPDEAVAAQPPDEAAAAQAPDEAATAQAPDEAAAAQAPEGATMVELSKRAQPPINAINVTSVTYNSTDPDINASTLEHMVSQHAPVAQGGPTNYEMDTRLNFHQMPARAGSTPELVSRFGDVNDLHAAVNAAVAQHGTAMPGGGIVRVVFDHPVGIVSSFDVNGNAFTATNVAAVAYNSNSGQLVTVFPVVPTAAEAATAGGMDYTTRQPLMPTVPSTSTEGANSTVPGNATVTVGTFATAGAMAGGPPGAAVGAILGSIVAIIESRYD